MAALTQAQLAADLRALGVTPGAVLIVHTRMSALGRVIGGSEAVVRALLDALGPAGTLVGYVSWEEHVYQVADWPAEHRDAYAASPPVFDPATGEASRDHGRIPERIRTWPGAQRSAHPEASVAAVGARAAEVCARHTADDGYGPTSPFALVEQVLMLGAPLDTLTILHHAEAVSTVEPKRRITFRIPVLEDGRVVEREYTDIETSEGAYPYGQLGLDDDEFAVIGREALAAGVGLRGRVGEAECHLFDARELVRFGVAWLEERFG